MNWVCELTKDAEGDLGDLPKNVQKRVARVLAQMQADPFQGDVKALRGDEWRGVFRRRLGNYRIIFVPDSGQESSAYFGSSSDLARLTAERGSPCATDSNENGDSALYASPLRWELRIAGSRRNLLV